MISLDAIMDLEDKLFDLENMLINICRKKCKERDLELFRNLIMELRLARWHIATFRMSLSRLENILEEYFEDEEELIKLINEIFNE